MIFWICVFIAVAAIPVGVALMWPDYRSKGDIGALGLGALKGGTLGIFPALCGVIMPWGYYANDYANVVAQEQIIAEYQQQRDELQATLSGWDFPIKTGIALDHDTPVASLTQELSRLESELTEARAERAKAIRSIESWKRGPMSGVVTMVGDPMREVE